MPRPGLMIGKCEIQLCVVEDDDDDDYSDTDDVDECRSVVRRNKKVICQ